MNFQKIFIPAAGVTALALAYYLYGWSGVAAIATGLVMWMLLHFTRMMTILKRAANRPIGYVDSAVMLNAKLQTEKDVQPEVFRWTDGTDSHVTCTFVGGKLAHHELFRPAFRA